MAVAAPVIITAIAVRVIIIPIQTTTAAVIRRAIQLLRAAIRLRRAIAHLQADAAAVAVAAAVLHHQGPQDNNVKQIILICG